MALRASFTICLFRKFHSVRPGIEGDNAQTAALIGRRLGLRVELVGCTTCGLSSEIGRSSGPLPIEVEGRFALHPVGSGHRRCLMTDDTKQLATIARLLGEILGEVRKIREQQERKQSEKGSLSSPISQMK